MRGETPERRKERKKEREIGRKQGSCVDGLSERWLSERGGGRVVLQAPSGLSPPPKHEHIRGTSVVERRETDGARFELVRHPRKWKLNGNYNGDHFFSVPPFVLSTLFEKRESLIYIFIQRFWKRNAFSLSVFGILSKKRVIYVYFLIQRVWKKNVFRYFVQENETYVYIFFNPKSLKERRMFFPVFGILSKKTRRREMKE